MEELESNEPQVVYQPFTLCEQCIEVCVRNPKQTLFTTEQTECLMEIDDNDEEGDTGNSVEVIQYTDLSQNTCYELRMPLYLPAVIWEQLFQKIIKRHPDQYMQAFSDPRKCRLTKINVSTTHTKEKISDQKILTKFFDHSLQEVILRGCEITPTTLVSLRNCQATLTSLDLSSVPKLKSFTVLKDLRNLTKLNLQDTGIGFSKYHMKYIGDLPRLSWLDLSNTAIDHSSLQDLSKLSSSLQWLSLHQCTNIKDMSAFRTFLERMTNLVHLDVSKNPVEVPEGSSDSNSVLPYPVVDAGLMELFAEMPTLLSLDISGSTGLKMADVAHFTNIGKKLKFLGACNTDGLSQANPMPAEKVTGEANEEQILTTLEIYPDREKFVAGALRKLFNLASHHRCDQIERCLRLIVTAMHSFKNNSGILIAATASLYHLSRENDPANSISVLRKEIIQAILESMENNVGLLQLQKNSCLTLCNFKIPTEVEFEYRRVSQLLLTALKNHSDDYLRRIAIMLFNAIVCQNAENEKKEIGLGGAMEILMTIIREKIVASQADILMETCWSALWNITDTSLHLDETPANCSDFLGHGGMDIFMECLTLFPDSIEIHRNMMGLMGNIAEVKELRPQLMNDDFIQLFLSLLSSDADSLEVSYNSAGLLSHVLSDGDLAWTITSITRDQCMTEMINAIDSWNVNSSRNINYRSFKPIIELLGCTDAPAAQHWSAWALANLTKIQPHKYCKLVEKEGGLDALGKIVDNQYSRIRTRELSAMVIESCRHDSRLR